MCVCVFFSQCVREQGAVVCVFFPQCVREQGAVVCVFLSVLESRVQ